jgi:hypothetical protein
MDFTSTLTMSTTFSARCFGSAAVRNGFAASSDATTMWFQVLGGDHLVQQVHDLFHVLLVKVVRAPLVPRLRPATHRRATRLLVLHRLVAFRGAKREHVQVGAVGVEEQRRISRVLIVESRERVELRHRSHVHRRLLDGHVERNRLEEVSGRGREERDAV